MPIETTGPTPGHPEERCHRCGGRNISWYTPGGVWDPFMRADPDAGWLWNEIICPLCFVELAGGGTFALIPMKDDREPWTSADERAHIIANAQAAPPLAADSGPTPGRPLTDNEWDDLRSTVCGCLSDDDLREVAERIKADAYQQGLRANPSEGHNLAWETGYQQGLNAGWGLGHRHTREARDALDEAARWVHVDDGTACAAGPAEGSTNWCDEHDRDLRADSTPSEDQS